MTIHLYHRDLPHGLDLGPVVAIDTETRSFSRYFSPCRSVKVRTSLEAILVH